MAGEESQERLAKAPMPKGPVVVAQVATLQEADVIRTVLAGEGIDAFIPMENSANIAPHMALALCPRGVEVLVPGDRAEEACRVLAKCASDARTLPGRVPEPLRQRVGDWGETPDDLARRARGSVLLSLLVWPLCVVTLWYVLRALRQGQRQAPRDASRFGGTVLFAAFFGVVVPLLCLFVLVVLAGGGWRFDSWLPKPSP